MQTISDSTFTLETFDCKMLEFPMATEIRYEFVVVLIDAFDNAALDKDRTNAGPSRYESCEVIDAQINQNIDSRWLLELGVRSQETTHVSAW